MMQKRIRRGTATFRKGKFTRRITALVLCASMVAAMLPQIIMPASAAESSNFRDLYIREADENTMDSYVQASLGGFIYKDRANGSPTNTSFTGVDGVTTATVRNNYGTRFAGEVWSDLSVFARYSPYIAEIRPFEENKTYTAARLNAAAAAIGDNALIAGITPADADASGNPVANTGTPLTAEQAKQLNAAINALMDPSDPNYKFTGDGDFDGETLILERHTDGVNSSVTIGEDSDFLQVFSALGSSQQLIDGGPLDVMLVLDVSGSMGNSAVEDSRITQAVNALNESIQTLMSLHPANRVGVTVFASRAAVLMELDHYAPLRTEGAGDDAKEIYVDVTGQPINGNLDTYYNIVATKATKTPNGVVQNAGSTTTVKATWNSNAQDRYRYPSGGEFDVDGDTGTWLDIGVSTAMDAGLWLGMSRLAARDPAELVVELNGVKTVRTPSVVLLGDGAPTFLAMENGYNLDNVGEMDLAGDPVTGAAAYGTGDWWNLPDLEHDNYGVLGRGNNTALENEVLALGTIMRVSLMKAIVNNHYRAAAKEYSATNADSVKLGFYSVGVEVGQGLGTAVFNPGDAATGFNARNPNAQVAAAYNDWLSLSGTRPQKVNLTIASSLLETSASSPSGYRWWSARTVSGQSYTKSRNVSFNPFPGAEFSFGANRIAVSTAEFNSIMNEGYTDLYFDVSNANQLGDTLGQIMTMIAAEPYRPVTGVNSSGVDDSLTFVNPVGEYMSIDSVTDLTLFGEHYRVEPYDVYDYAVNQELLDVKDGDGKYRFRQSQDPKDPAYEFINSGWYLIETDAAGNKTYDYRTDNLPGYSNQQMFKAGWVHRITYLDAATIVPTLPKPQGSVAKEDVLTEKQMNTVYTGYRITGQYPRKAPNDTSDMGDKWTVVKDGAITPINETNSGNRPNLSYMVNGETKVTYDLVSDILMWVEDTGDYHDTSAGDFVIDSAYDEALYLNISTDALPVQLATVTRMTVDNVIVPTEYETNLNNTYSSTPLRIYYNVSLDPDYLRYETAADAAEHNKDKAYGVALADMANEYTSKNVGSDFTVHGVKDGNRYVAFYSNYFSNDTYNEYPVTLDSTDVSRGNAATTFAPGSANQFYRFQKNRVLFLIPGSWGSSTRPAEIDFGDVSKLWLATLTERHNLAAFDAQGNLIMNPDGTAKQSGETTPITAVRVFDSEAEALDAVRKANGVPDGTALSDEILKAANVHMADPNNYQDLLSVLNATRETSGEGGLHSPYWIAGDCMAVDGGDNLQDIEHIFDWRVTELKQGSDVEDALLRKTQYEARLQAGGHAFQPQIDSNNWYYIIREFYYPEFEGSQSGSTENVDVHYMAIARKGSEFGSGLANGTGMGEYVQWYDTATGATDVFTDNSTNNHYGYDEYVDEKGIRHPAKGDFGYIYPDGVTPDPNDPEKGNIGHTHDGTWYLSAKPGGLRVGGMANFVGAKGYDIREGADKRGFATDPAVIAKANVTEQARTYFLPTVSSYTAGDSDAIINIFHGNNGRILVESNTLLLTKTVNNVRGEVGALVTNDEFEFIVNIDDYIGLRKAALVTRDEFDSSLWRRRFESIDLITDNRDLLMDEDNNLAIVDGDGKRVVQVVGDTEALAVQTSYYYASRNDDGELVRGEDGRIAPNLENEVPQSTQLYYVYVGKNVSPAYGNNVVRVFEADANDLYGNLTVRGGRTFYVGPDQEELLTPDDQLATARPIYKRAGVDANDKTSTKPVNHYAGDREYWLSSVYLIPMEDVGSNWAWPFDDKTLQDPDELPKVDEETGIDENGFKLMTHFVVATLRAGDATGSTSATLVESDHGYALRSAYLTRTLEFKSMGNGTYGQATVYLKDGEGLVFNGIDDKSWYTITEVLDVETQAKKGVRFQEVTHIQDDDIRTGYIYNPDAERANTSTVPGAVIQPDQTGTGVSVRDCYSPLDMSPVQLWEADDAPTKPAHYLAHPECDPDSAHFMPSEPGSRISQWDKNGNHYYLYYDEDGTIQRNAVDHDNTDADWHPTMHEAHSNVNFLPAEDQGFEFETEKQTYTVIGDTGTVEEAVHFVNFVPEIVKLEYSPGAGESVYRGDQIDYSVRWVNSNFTNTNFTDGTVVITDPLDDGVDFVSATFDPFHGNLFDDELLAGGEDKFRFDELDYRENGPAASTPTLADSLLNVQPVTLKLPDLSNPEHQPDSDGYIEVDGVRVKVENGKYSVTQTYTYYAEEEQQTPGTNETTKVRVRKTFNVTLAYFEKLDAGAEKPAGYPAAGGHTLVWTLDKAPAGTFGFVELSTQVNDRAIEGWQYASMNNSDHDDPPTGYAEDNSYVHGDHVEGGDIYVVNQAGVKVENYAEIATEVIFNYTGDPHKTEDAPGDGMQVNVGETIQYSIDFSNYKTENAAVTIEDRLDPGVNFILAGIEGLTGIANNKVELSEANGLERAISLRDLLNGFNPGGQSGNTPNGDTVTSTAPEEGSAVTPDESEPAEAPVESEPDLSSEPETSEPEEPQSSDEIVDFPAHAGDDVEEPAFDGGATEDAAPVVTFGSGAGVQVETRTTLLAAPGHEDDTPDGEPEGEPDDGFVDESNPGSEPDIDIPEGDRPDGDAAPNADDPENPIATLAWESGKVYHFTGTVVLRQDPGDGTGAPVNIVTEVEITYDTRTTSDSAGGLVTWTLKNVPALYSGKVYLTVQVANEDAAARPWKPIQRKQSYDYGTAEEYDTNGVPDYRVYNKSRVAVGVVNPLDNSVTYDYWRDTNIVYNPIKPEKEEIYPGNGNSIAVGGEITYTVTWKNTTDAAANVVITDHLDPGATFVSAGFMVKNAQGNWVESTTGPAPNGNACTVEYKEIKNSETGFAADPEEHTVIWTLPNRPAATAGTDGEGSYGMVWLKVKANVAAREEWQYNTEEPQEAGDPNPGEIVQGSPDNQSDLVRNMAIVSVNNVPELTNEVINDVRQIKNPQKIENSPGKGNLVREGQEIEYSITWHNDGYENGYFVTSDVIVTDRLDPGVDLVEMGLKTPGAGDTWVKTTAWTWTDGELQHKAGTPEDGTVDADYTDHTVTWTLNERPAEADGEVYLIVKVNDTAKNMAQYNPNTGVITAGGGTDDMVYNMAQVTVVKADDNDVINGSDQFTEIIENPLLYSVAPEKHEVTPGAGLLVSTDGRNSTITYTISWKNDAWETDSQGNEKMVAADVVITDMLDPGLTPLRAGIWNLNSELPGGKEWNAAGAVTSEGSLPDGCSVRFIPDTRTVEWTLKDRPAGDSGRVFLTVTVNENAKFEHSYNEATGVIDQAETTKIDNKVWNMAKVVVQEADTAKVYSTDYTKTVENPLRLDAPTFEKIERTPGSGETVNVGDEIVYTISWMNDAVQYDRYQSANVTVTDYLDPGLSLVEAGFVDSISETGEIKLSQSWKRNAADSGWDASTGAPRDPSDPSVSQTVEYDNVSTFRMVRWTLKSRAPTTTGLVYLKVRVNDSAKLGYTYSAGETFSPVVGPNDDMVYNKARVHVENGTDDVTAIVENPVRVTVKPEKTENSPGADKIVGDDDPITYVISWKNDAIENKQSATATVTVTDVLDPGLKFESAGVWDETKPEGQREIPLSAAADADGRSVVHSGGTVTWTLNDRAPASEGKVYLKVKVDAEKAKLGYTYYTQETDGDLRGTFNTTAAADDNIVHNMAKVAVSNGGTTQYTDVVSNPLLLTFAPPVKTETSPGPGKTVEVWNKKDADDGGNQDASTVTYTITWTNDYIEDDRYASANVVVTDHLDPGVDLVEVGFFNGSNRGPSWTVNGDTFSQTGNDAKGALKAEYANHTVTWTLNNRDAKSTGTVYLKVRVNDKAKLGYTYNAAAGTFNTTPTANDDMIYNMALVQAGTAAVRTTAVVENPILNVVKPEKIETNPGVNKIVDDDQVITYRITWKNNAIVDGKAASAIVTVTDNLDPGLSEVVEAGFIVLDAGNNEVESTTDTNCQVVRTGRTVTWVLQNRDPASEGQVYLKVRVDADKAKLAHSYNTATGIIDDENTTKIDNMVYNMASVAVTSGTNFASTQYTEVLSNPLRVDFDALVKRETSATEGKKVRDGNRITYTISWNNNYIDQNEYKAATVTVTDQLDPGVDLVEVGFVDGDGSKDIFKKAASWNWVGGDDGNWDESAAPPELAPTFKGETAAYRNHTVTWTLTDREARASGWVYLVVEVNENAEKDYGYDADGNITGTGAGIDDMIFNMAVVQVADGTPRTTEEVRNPVDASVTPEKLETYPGANKYVREKGTITYAIKWKNDAIDAVTNVYKSSTVKVIDNLDPGLDLIEVGFVDGAVDQNGKFDKAVNWAVSGDTFSQTSGDLKAEYANHTVTWTLDNCAARETGWVYLTVKVNGEAAKGNAYYTEVDQEAGKVTEDLVGTFHPTDDKDNIVYNMAKVAVTDGTVQFTEVVSNPLLRPAEHSKAELSPGAGQKVKKGDKIHYTVKWVNDALKDGEYTETSVTVTDYLDPGLTFTAAGFMTASGKEGDGWEWDGSTRGWTKQPALPEKCTVTYDPVDHVVTWELEDCAPGSTGEVFVVAETNADAEKAFSYNEDDGFIVEVEGEKNDNMVYNKAHVAVLGGTSGYTAIVMNPVGKTTRPPDDDPDVSSEPESDVSSEPESDVSSEPESDVSSEPESDVSSEPESSEPAVPPSSSNSGSDGSGGGKAPQTGDESQLLLWLIFLSLSLLGFCVTGYLAYKKNRAASSDGRHYKR